MSGLKPRSVEKTQVILVPDPLGSSLIEELAACRPKSWKDVFIYKNIELTAGQFSATVVHVLGNTQSHIRSWAKLQFLVGLVKRCMDLSGRSATSDTMAQLGDLATRVSLVEGMILGAEAAAEPDPFA